MEEIGLMTNNDKYLLSYRYESIERLIVNNGNGYGLVDTDDNVILPLIYDRISIVGKFAVTRRIEDDYMLMYTIDGKFVKQIWYTHILDKYNSGLNTELLIVYNQEDNSFCFISDQGNLKTVNTKIESNQSIISSFVNESFFNLYYEERDEELTSSWYLANKYKVHRIPIGIFSSNGDTIFLGGNADYVDSDRYLKIKTGEELNTTKLYVIDEQKFVEIPNVDIVTFLPNGNIIGKVEDSEQTYYRSYKYCLLNYNFEVLLENYNDILLYCIDDPFIIAEKDRRYYFYDLNAKSILPYSIYKYSIFPYWGDVYICIENDDLKMILNSRFEVILPLYFDDFKFEQKLYVLPFKELTEENWAEYDYYVRKVQRFNGKTIDCRADKSYYFSIPNKGKKFVPVKKNGLWGLINSKFEVVVPFEYNDIEDVSVSENNEILHKGDIFIGRKQNDLYRIDVTKVEYLGIKYKQIHYFDKAYENEELFCSDLNKTNIQLY